MNELSRELGEGAIVFIFVSNWQEGLLGHRSWGSIAVAGKI